MKRVFDRLQSECARRGDERFETLRPFLALNDDAPSLGEPAERLGLSIAAFKSLLHRFRQRHRELLREEVRETVDSEEEVLEELKGILEALRR